MTDAADNPWHDLLRSRLRGRPTPMLVTPEALWSAASLWAGTRAWTGAFRAAGLTAGDRLVCALPAGPAFVQVLLACLWDGIACTPLDPGRDVRGAVLALDARALVVTDRAGLDDLMGVFAPDAAAQPPGEVPALRVMATIPPEGTALTFFVPGGDGGTVHTDWSTGEVIAALDRHALRHPVTDVRVLSMAAWHEAFGLISGCLSPLLDADEIVCGVGAPDDADAVVRAVPEHAITHLVLTPELASLLMGFAGGRDLLRAVGGGVVGGGPMDAALREALRHTRLRLG